MRKRVNKCNYCGNTYLLQLLSDRLTSGVEEELTWPNV